MPLYMVFFYHSEFNRVKVKFFYNLDTAYEYYSILEKECIESLLYQFNEITLNWDLVYFSKFCKKGVLSDYVGTC